jgi:hypothetical protein
VNHSEGKGGERAVAIARFQGGSPHLCRLKTTPFLALMDIELYCTDCMLDLWGPVNLVA